LRAATFSVEREVHYRIFKLGIESEKSNKNNMLSFNLKLLDTTRINSINQLLLINGSNYLQVKAAFF